MNQQQSIPSVLPTIVPSTTITIVASEPPTIVRSDSPLEKPSVCLSTITSTVPTTEQTEKATLPAVEASTNP